MRKGSGTRSGLLWEVERILSEIKDSGGELPQILFMENVPQVHGKKNMADFQKWIQFLESLGYTNFWKDMNAKDYGIAQNRNRCFMFSFFGNYTYRFPDPIPLTKKLKDYLEDEVDEKYYINNEKAEKLIKQLVDSGKLIDTIHQTDRQTDRHVLMGQSTGRGGEKLRTASKLDTIAESQICNQKETWLLKNMGETAQKQIDVAVTLRANKVCAGVIEVADVKVLGSLEAKFESTNRIYDVRGCSPTLSTMQGGNQEPKILESQIVAMRGRNPDNPSDRTVGSPTEQRLEVNMQGTSNCLTSVQKDNLLLENVKIRQATKDGSIECEIGGCFDASYPNSKTRRGRVQDKGNICPTLTAQNQEVVRIEKVGQISSNGSQCGTAISDNGISANLVARTHGYANSHIATQYRIRKLTPRECGRLMGVSDEDIDKMAAVNSNSQLYKQFGNSIVVAVMVAMFRNLNIEQE